MILMFEGWPLLPMAATCIGIAVTAYSILYQYSRWMIDAREPPVIASTIPFVGHILGMGLYGGKYIKNLGCGHLPASDIGVRL